MEEGSRDELKDILNVFLEKYERRSDIGKSIPQGICRYVQISTDKNDKEYSYLWDGEEISIGEKSSSPSEKRTNGYGEKSFPSNITGKRTFRILWGGMKKIICLENS